MMSSQGLSAFPYLILAIYALLAYFIWFCIRSVYRVTLHPLAKFPGPKIAAITKLYEIYWEIIKDGQYSNQIERLHGQYGPIIRISPSHLHIIDPQFYDQIYNFDKHVDRPRVTLDNLQHSSSFEVHRVRRKALGGLFTRTATARYEKMIRNNVALLCTRLSEAREHGDLVNLGVFFRCFTSDVILELTFGEPHGFLADPIKAQVFFNVQDSIFKNIYPLINFRIVYVCFVAAAQLPQWMIGSMGSQISFIKDTMRRLRKLHDQGMNATSKPKHAQSLIEAYATDEDLPRSDKGEKQLLDLALLLYSAGFETTGFTLDTAFYHLLDNPTTLKTLRVEIESAFPLTTYKPNDALPLSKLEKLPYLSAVIDESLRLSIGVMARLPRINTHSDLSYNGFVIPKGTPVAMSQRFMHYSPDHFPNPRQFDPKRWLQGPKSQELRRYWAPFSRGARICLGMNLALAEIYIAIATIIRQGFEFELFDTTRAEIDPAVDYFVPKPASTKGLRVKVRKDVALPSKE